MFKCNNDLNRMTDIGKVADLVLMDRLSLKGFVRPSILCLPSIHNFDRKHSNSKFKRMVFQRPSASPPILTSSRRRQPSESPKKKTVLDRGAKLFYLSGVLNGRYRNHEPLPLHPSHEIPSCYSSAIPTLTSATES